MASTYTVNIGIEKPGTGDQSGTWGTTTNTNFDIIDQATNGVATVTLAAAGTSGSPNTLLINNGALSDGRNRFIEFNDGADLGATAYVQLDPNDAEKIVHIRNSLSASRSLILFQGTYNASNDFEVPNGADVLVKFDGGGAGATVTDVNVNLTPTKLTTSDADINGGTIDGVTLGTNSAVTEAQVDNININGNTISSTDTNGNITLAPNGTGVVALSSTDLTFGDNDKAIFGAGSDLQIYHDGSNSYIYDAGTGSLGIHATNLNLKDANGAETYATFVKDGAATLYYDNAAKLATTNTGVEITGTLYVPEWIEHSSDSNTYFGFPGGDQFSVITAGQNRLKFVGSEAVFNEDGEDKDFRVESDGNTHSLFVDGGKNVIGISTNTTYDHQQGAAIDLSYDGTIWSGTNYWAGGLKTGATFYSQTSGDRYKLSSRNATQIHHNSQGGRIDFNVAAGGTAGDVITWRNVAEFQLSEVVFNEGSADQDFRVESDSNTHMLFVDAGVPRVNVGGDGGGHTFNVNGSIGLFGAGTDDRNIEIGFGRTDDGNAYVDLVGDTTYTDYGARFIRQGGENAATQIMHRGTGTLNIGTEDAGRVDFFTNSTGNRFSIDSSGNVTVNEGSADADFRVESDNNTHAFFLDAGNGVIGIRDSSPFDGIPLNIGGISSEIALGAPSPSTDTVDGARISMYTGNRDHQLYMGANGWGMCGNTESDFTYKSSTNANNGDVVMSIRWGATGTGRVRFGGNSDASGDSAQANPLVYADGTTSTRCALMAKAGGNDNVATIIATNASYSAAGGGVLYVGCRRAANSAYSFAGWYSTSNGALDREFNFRGDGEAYADGSWNGGGADYAEYFEWADGNPSSEDRRGMSVVLVNEKIRVATAADPTSSIIGVVSAMPAVVGDTAWNHWSEQFLRDDFGAYQWEEYTLTEWEETISYEEIDANGNPFTKTKKEIQSYETDRIPSDVTPPADAQIVSVDDKGNTLMRRVLNPDYDPTRTYVPREERPEWDAVGMVGKLRIRVGQPIGDRWIKLRDISSNVEEWLVR
jgi:hypothetical protein